MLRMMVEVRNVMVDDYDVNSKVIFYVFICVDALHTFCLLDVCSYHILTKLLPT